MNSCGNGPHFREERFRLSRYFVGQKFKYKKVQKLNSYSCGLFEDTDTPHPFPPPSTDMTIYTAKPGKLKLHSPEFFAVRTYS